MRCISPPLQPVNIERHDARAFSPEIGFNVDRVRLTQEGNEPIVLTITEKGHIRHAVICRVKGERLQLTIIESNGEVAVWIPNVELPMIHFDVSVLAFLRIPLQNQPHHLVALVWEPEAKRSQGIYVREFLASSSHCVFMF